MSETTQLKTFKQVFQTFFLGKLARTYKQRHNKQTFFSNYFYSKKMQNK